jgi:hypothetical protein
MAPESSSVLIKPATILDPHASVPVPVLSDGLVFVATSSLRFASCWLRGLFFARVGTGTGTHWWALSI